MEFFIFLGVLFFALIVGVIAVDHKHKGSHNPFWVVFLLLGANYWMHWFEYPVFDWKRILAIVATYLTVGAIWSMIKWFIYLRKWLKYNKDSTSEYIQIPHASDHKYDFSVWIAWWPLSILHWAVGSLLVDAIEWIASLFGGIYDRIGVAVLGEAYNQKYLNNK